jgi:hypothetical protein
MVRVIPVGMERSLVITYGLSVSVHVVSLSMVPKISVEARALFVMKKERVSDKAMVKIRIKW